MSARHWVVSGLGAMAVGYAVAASAVDAAPHISDREIVEALTELRVALKVQDQKMDQRFTAIEQSIDQRFKAMEQAIDQRFAVVDQRFAAVDQRFAAVDQRFAAVDRQFDAVNRRLDDGCDSN